MKGCLAKLVLVLASLTVVVVFVSRGVEFLWESLAGPTSSFTLGPLGDVLAVLRNPGAGLALCGIAFALWYRSNQEQIGGSAEAIHRFKSRLSVSGVRDLIASKTAAAVVAVGLFCAYLWFVVFGSIILFLPAAGAGLWACRRARAKFGGRGDPDAVLVPTRCVREPVWAVRRWGDAPGEVWLLLGEGYRSRGLYEHVLLVGRTGHGKGQDILLWEIAHSIACGQTSTVATDPKAEGYEATVALTAAQRGPEEPDGRPVWLLSTLAKHVNELVAGVNPCFDADSTARFAASIIAPTREPVWGQGARELFCALAKALDYPHDCVLQVYEAVKHRDVLTKLAKGSAEVRAAYDVNKPGMEENFRKSVKAALSALERERVARLFRGAGRGVDFSRKIVVYVCFLPDADQDARPLLAGILDYLYAAAYEAGEPGKGGPGAEFIVDEAKKCAAIHRFPDYLAIARGNRVRFLVCVQNVSQLVDELDEPATQDLLDSLPLKIIGQSGDERTKTLAEDESGQVAVVRGAAGGKVPLLDRMMSYERARMAEWSGQSWERRPRIRGDHVKELPKSEWLLVGAGLAERVLGASWRNHAAKIVTDEMRDLPINRAGISGAGDLAEERSQNFKELPEVPDEDTEDPPKLEETKSREPAGNAPVLRLVGAEDRTERVACPYCESLNAVGDLDCNQCGMPLGGG